MEEWSRETPWRQGHVLCAEAMKLAHLAGTRDSPFAVVISHDCDLANSADSEPNVEIIEGRVVSVADGNFTHAKNARKLHLNFQSTMGVVTIELNVLSKNILKKSELASFVPNSDYKLDSDSRTILQCWLAARYRRSAFPNEFESRLSKAKLNKKIKKILEPTKEAIVAIFFDVDEGVEIDRNGPDDLYQLGIYLLYESQQDTSLELAKTAAKKIEDAFDVAFKTTEGVTKQIQLLYCDVMSDQAMTYYQSVQFKQMRLEHLSLEDSPIAAMLPQ